MVHLPIQHALDRAVQYHRAGQLPEAEALYRQILAVDPHHADCLHLLGVIARQTGAPARAVDLILQALALAPQAADFHYNLALALMNLGERERAIAACRQAIELRPIHGDAFNALAGLLMEANQIEEALAAAREAIRLRPDLADAHNTLGNLLRLNEAHAEAIAAYRRALELRPAYPEAWNNLGTALAETGEFGAAIDGFQRARALAPHDARTENNLANALKSTGELEAAIACYRRSLAVMPDHSAVHSNLIYLLHFHPGYDAVAISHEHRCWNQRFADPLRPSLRPHANERDPERRLRVGYVSPDFWAQAECYFVVPLLAGHDHTCFEIHAYASVVRPDHVTALERRHVDVWHDVLPLSDEALAEKIRADGIDILVDLTMHMARNRLLVFARKPAPVQVTWLAYPGSTGLETMDYRITDATIDPPDEATPGYSERSLRLPDSWCCYDPLSRRPPVPAPPARGRDFIRFGCLNNFCKLNDATLHLWARLLGAVPASRLLILTGEGGHRGKLCQTLQQCGIAADRVEFARPCPRDRYLELYEQVDIALDTLPYNGITTTCDALWMGVPVVSLSGQNSAGRVGKSLLGAIGLAELTTHDPEEWVRLTAALAGDRPRLESLRAGLRARMESSPLMDGRRFARDLEAAYRTAWRAWCTG